MSLEGFSWAHSSLVDLEVLRSTTAEPWYLCLSKCLGPNCILVTNPCLTVGTIPSFTKHKEHPYWPTSASLVAHMIPSISVKWDLWVFNSTWVLIIQCMLWDPGCCPIGVSLYLRVGRYITVSRQSTPVNYSVWMWIYLRAQTSIFGV